MLDRGRAWTYTACSVVDKGKAKAQDYPAVYSAESTSLAPPYLPKAPTPSPSSTITFLPPFNDVSPPQTPTTTTLLFSTDVEDHTLQTNITSPLATSSPLYQLPSPSKRSPTPSPYTSPNPRRKAHTKLRPTHLSPTSSTTRSNSHSHSCSSSFFSPSGRDIPPDDSSFSRQTPPIRKTGYISLVDHDAELSSFLAHSLSLSSSSSTPSTPTSPERKGKPNQNINLKPYPHLLNQESLP
ncbi:hypothetical protein D9756_000107 [Leucocoprinus leucothites]|uniref:Uncharacterized protein n=1 Tax=Leucocoprinus leucothites TaxID=201217 RepID=A0A8H5GFW5_9AGAR|nr:hypothetical protein D9756_000107 [Leucoagaricus leucothites]